MRRRIDLHGARAPQRARAGLARTMNLCHWTDGLWEELGGPALLSSALVRAYLNNRRMSA
jgi:hypothetical protein